MKLIGEAYWWWKNNHRFCQCWFVLQEFLRTRYAPHLHAFKVDCKEPNVDHKPELERTFLSDLVAKCKEVLVVVGKILENIDAKGTDPEPPGLVETEVINNPEPKPEVEG